MHQNRKNGQKVEFYIEKKKSNGVPSACVLYL